MFKGDLKWIDFLSLFGPRKNCWAKPEKFVCVLPNFLGGKNLKSLTYSFPMRIFSTHWKNQKTLRFSDVFRACKKGALGTNGLKKKYSESSHIKWLVFRSSHLRRSISKCVLKNFVNFAGKHLCQSLFSNKVADLRPENTSKRLLLHFFYFFI